jgi:carboxylate-amine ligase
VATTPTRPAAPGKGLAAGSSVLEHRFGTTRPYTVGVEEELMLVDPQTLDLTQHIDTVLAGMTDGALGQRVGPELMQSVIEVGTSVCETAAEVAGELRKLRAYVAETAAARGVRVGSAGTHPFSFFERQRITRRDRYRQLVDQLQYVARRELIFGCHVHVAVDDPEKTIQVMSALLAHLSDLLALSASSPFWRGEPTGLESSRQVVFAAMPRSGPPPRFRDYEDYAELVGQLERTGCIADYTHIWWDVRPHPRFGTLEVRVMDAVMDVEHTAAIAAYVQSIVKYYSEIYDEGRPLPSYHRILVSENKWLAARHGLQAPVMDLATGRRNRVPAAQLIRRTLRDIEPHARELGSERELEGINEILGNGNGATRQLRVFNANRDLVEVMEEILSGSAPRVS